MKTVQQEFWTPKNGVTGQRLRTPGIQNTHTHTCVKLFDLHLRLPHYNAAVRLTPERNHRSCQGNLRGLHDCTLLLRLQHLHTHAHAQTTRKQEAQANPAKVTNILVTWE